MESELPNLRFHFALVLLLFTALHFCSGAPSPTFTNETDRLALLEFRNRIVGNSHQLLNSWNPSHHFCRWEGITCGSRHRQRVVALRLEGFGLRSSLPSSFGNLTFLRGIHLPNNKFSGEIPHEIGKLFRLRYLNLSDNEFGGTIPPNLAYCTYLRVLDLSGNKFTGKMPIELGNFAKLTALYLERNSLTGRIPTSFGNMSSLIGLSLRDNDLEGEIPSEMGRIKVLEALEISGNRLSGEIPHTLYNHSSLQYFYFVNNSLHGSLPPNVGFTLPHLIEISGGLNYLTGTIPASLSNVSGLETIDFANNHFKGAVPTTLGGLSQLTRINLGDNKFESGLIFLSSLINCTSLQTLALDHNQFHGMLPDLSVKLSMTNLQTLTLGANQIHGNISTWIGDLVNLEVLGLEENFFTGEVPNSFGKLQNMKQMDVHANSLSGKIPPFIGNFSTLSELYMEENNFRGTIPRGLGNCRKLAELNLSYNELSGSIPEQVIGLSSLSIFLDLSFNSFNGQLPMQVNGLKSLGALHLSGNNLSGEIPSTLGECSSLEYLHLDGNFFEGAIPESLKSLRGLVELDLSRNKLSGRIPDFLGKLPLLNNLNLSFNDLLGDVPKVGLFTNASKFSVVGNNELCGGIPDLRLPVCVVPKSKRHGKSIPFKVILPVSSVILGFILLSCFFVLRGRLKSISWIPTCSTSLRKNGFLRISYTELLRATNGFSSANLLGIGSYGSVYKGFLRDGEEKTVAVKVLNLQARGGSKSFMTECSTLRNIRHRNLVKILTACSGVDYRGNDFKALVFEFMVNGSLEDWLHPQVDVQPRARNLSFGQRLNVAIDVACALDYLHHSCETPIVHRDLKPSNVLLDEDMNAQVGDFGLAKFIHSGSTSIRRNQPSSAIIKGSIGYVAPEYAMGAEASTRGDVYSYGILLLEIFTGRRPTEEMFKDGLNLHEFSKRGLSEGAVVMETIADPCLFIEDTVTNTSVSFVEKCLVSVLKIGIMCSVDSPGDRVDIKDVITELCVIREEFLGVGTH